MNLLIATAGWSASDIAILVTAFGGAITGVISALRATQAANSIKEAHKKLDTDNGKTIGQSVHDIEQTVNHNEEK